MTKTILIESEHESLEALKQIVLRHPTLVSLVECCSTLDQAFEIIVEHKPDLILLDPEKEREDLLNQLLQCRLSTIYMTSRDSHFLKTSTPNVIDHVTKPIDEISLIVALSKVKSLRERSELNDKMDEINRRIDSLVKSANKRSKIMFYSIDGNIIVDTMDIIYFMSERNYTRVYFTNGKNAILSKTLKLVEEMISSDAFLRIHHSYLINIDKIKNYINQDGGYLNMINNDSIPVSRGRRKELFDRFPML
jgi:two-component system LytT family response regulator